MGDILKAEIKGDKALAKAFKDQPEKVKLGVTDALEIIGRLMLNRALAKILKGPKTGRMYGGHQASAPGEAPASRSGKLVSSGKYIVDRSKLIASISFSALYARMLEWGTRFMAARPFLFSTVDEVKKDIPRIFGKLIKARLKK